MQNKTREILLEAFYKIKDQSGVALERVDFELIGVRRIDNDVDYHCERIEIHGQSVASKEGE